MQTRIRKNLIVTLALAVALLSVPSCSKHRIQPESSNTKTTNIVVSDFILLSIVEQLLPEAPFSVSAILPPGQCPGHYDVKLSDMEKVRKSALAISFSDSPLHAKMSEGADKLLSVDSKHKNWMVPETYVEGITFLAEKLAGKFPENSDAIRSNARKYIDRIHQKETVLLKQLRNSYPPGSVVVASDMQRELLEWMGFGVLGRYGRPESISTKELVAYIENGKKQKAVLVVDNLQSGPDIGRNIAESLRVPHVVLSNFPSEKGYLATLENNVNSILKAARENNARISR